MKSEQMLQAEKLKLSGQHKQAIDILEQMLVDDLYNVQAYEELGDNYLSIREFEKATKALKFALRIDPISANAHYLLGFTYSCQNNFEESIKELEVADKIEPNHPEIIRCLGWSIFNAGKKQQGLVLLYRANHLAPNDSLIMFDLCVCLLNSLEFDKAEQIFQSVLMNEPDNMQALECLKACSHFRTK